MEIKTKRIIIGCFTLLIIILMIIFVDYQTIFQNLQRIYDKVDGAMSEAMSSKQRVLAALEHRESDRLPLGFFAVDHDTVEQVIGRKSFLRAKADSQIALWEGRRDEVAQSWREDAIEFYSKLDVIDMVPAHAMASSVLPPAGYEPLRPEKIDDVTWRDWQGREARPGVSARPCATPATRKNCPGIG